MSDEPAVESGQFSSSGQTGQADQGLSGCFEPEKPDQLRTNGRLYLIADSVGGITADPIASRYAVQKILHDYYHAQEPDLKKRLLAVIQVANNDILERNKRFPERRPMATTLTAALIHQNKLLVANVGDGRVYAVWDQDIEQLNQHTEADEQVKGEEKAPSTSMALVKAGSLRHLIPTGLGLEQPVRIEVFSRRLFAGDTVVLCSGGLTGYLTKAEIAKTVTKSRPQQASRQLVDLARKQGCRDNISTGVVRLLPQAAAAAKPLRSVNAPALKLPSHPDWDALAKPFPIKQPTQLVPATPQPQWQKYESMQSRRRWLLVAILILLLAIICPVWAAYWGWQSWQETRVVSTESQPGSETSDQVETEQGVSDSIEEATTASQEAAGLPPQQTPTPDPIPAATGDVRLATEGNSPLPTPQSGGSTGDVISSTFSSPLSTGQTGAQMGASIPSGPTPTPLPTIELPADCTSKGRFDRDVSVPDGQEFAPGVAFEKSWSVQNEGTCPWGPGFTVRFVEGDRMSGTEQRVIEVTEPGEKGTFTVPMVAPSSEGAHQSTWQLYTPADEPFGPELYVEIEVVPGAAPPLDETAVNTLYDFIENAEQATWLAGNSTYRIEQTPINQDLVIPYPQGIVAVGEAEFGGNYQAPGPVLLTHPHQEVGYIQGNYAVDTPLQPGDVLAATLGFPKAAVINDDGVTFEVTFKPDEGQEQVIFSKLVKYEDTPLTVRQLLTEVEPDQTGVFTLRVDGGDSLSYDWAVWVDVQLVRP
jgi:serine/threonine protein phosphatase PrpC